MSSYIADLGYLLGTNTSNQATNSTSRKGNTELDMQDFLQLMIVQLQNQTIDDTMDTSEMMNQLVQMQMVTAMTNMTDATLMGYASSLVGKTVTIGLLNGNTLEEREIEVIGTGMSNGQQVIFGSDGNTYGLNQIMAIGRLPEIKDPDPTDPPEGDTGTDNKPGGVDGSGETTDPSQPDDSTDRPVDGTGGSEGADNTGSGSEEGAVDPTQTVE